VRGSNGASIGLNAVHASADTARDATRATPIGRRLVSSRRPVDFVGTASFGDIYTIPTGHLAVLSPGATPCTALALIAGLALGDGLIRSLDDKAGDYALDDGFRSEQNRDITWRHLLTDTVEKLGPTAGRRKIRITSGVLANHCFALGRVRESSLRRPGAKIVFQQHRPRPANGRARCSARRTA
jgi:hypothetical protein